MNQGTSKIRVGLDCRDLFIATTGSKTYLSELISASTNMKNVQIEFVELYPFFPMLNIKGRLGKICKHIAFIVWKQFFLPLRASFKNCDVLICTDYFLPSYEWGKKHIAVFHDAFFWEYPQHYNRFWLRLFHLWAVPAAKRADCILVPSHYAKSRLMQFMHLSDERFAVVYEAPKSFNKTENSHESFSMGVLSDAKYLLHVGVLNKHKNLTSLIKSFKTALSPNDSHWHLVLIGGAAQSQLDDDSIAIRETIEALGLTQQVHLLGYVKDDVLAHYYSKASGYIFPSYNEGFGLPLLEAMRFGLPIAAADNTCLPEIGKNAAIYFDPHNVSDIAKSIKKIMAKDQDVMDSLTNQEAVLSNYTWKKAVLEISTICQQVVIGRASSQK